MERKFCTATGQWDSQVERSMRIPSLVGIFVPACRMDVHCCIKDTGGLPTLVASWTLNMFSYNRNVLIQHVGIYICKISQIHMKKREKKLLPHKYNKLIYTGPWRDGIKENLEKYREKGSKIRWKNNEYLGFNNDDLEI